MLKVKVKVKHNIQNYIKTLGLLPHGKIQTFIDSKVVMLSDPYVPSDTASLRKSVFIKTDFGSGRLIYTVYGNKEHNTWNDTTSRFQDAPKRGSFWTERMMNDGGRESLLLGLKRLLSRR